MAGINAKKFIKIKNKILFYIIVEEDFLYYYS